MLKIILMTQLYYADGTYEFRNFPVYVRTEQECREMAPRAIELAALMAEIESGKSKAIQQTGFSCTDSEVVLDFWAIPEWVPIPTSKPKEYSF